jgi:micrococcal nuclease
VTSIPELFAPTTYTVVAGDSLSKIATELDVSVTALAAYNQIVDPSRIVVGQVLQIPPVGYVPPTAVLLPPTDTPAPAPAAPTETASAFAGMVPAQVVEVVDGDTIKVVIDGAQYTVRYIGIDTPETVHPDMDVQWMGPEASAANKAMVAGQTVYLEKDVSETDRYGRLLRYIWLADGRMVNEELCRQGYAQVSTYPPDIHYQDRFLAAQQAARDAGLGLWGIPPEQAVEPTATWTPIPVPTVYVAPTQPAQNCDPSYPTVCIPPPPPDLDCGQIPYRRFQVVGADPHRFDGDHDGVGCESG